MSNMSDFQFGLLTGVLAFCGFLEELDSSQREAAIELSAKFAAKKIEEDRGVPLEDIMLEIDEIVKEAFKRPK